jgi:required for meiotic nuclear division protein 1
VFFRVPAVEEEEVVRSLRSRIVEPLETPEIEQVAISLQSGADDQVEPAGGVALRDASPERLQIVANVLSKSAVLAHHESQIAATFDRIEPLAVGIKRRGRVDREARQLIQQMGDILLTQHRMVGRVEIEDKPDILWDRPELERTYARLEDEYELLERSRAIDRKLTLVGETVRIVLELVQDQRGVRLEWYIIGLIVIEVLLSMYQIAFPVH